MSTLPNIPGWHTWIGYPTKETIKTWQILLQLYSISTYKKFWGKINLFANKETIDFYEKINILSHYNKVEEFDMDLLQGINTRAYFAVSKILAQLQVDDEECIFLDTDLVILNSPLFADWVNKGRVSVFHYETLDTYPECFDFVNYDGPVNDAFPVNGALIFWKDKALRRQYASEALKFIRANPSTGKYLTYNDLMITAEQRILGMFLKDKGIEPQRLIKEVYDTSSDPGTIKWIDVDGKNYYEIDHAFYHLWNFKDQLNEDPVLSAEVSMQLIQHLEKTSSVNVDEVLKAFNHFVD